MTMFSEMDAFPTKFFIFGVEDKALLTDLVTEVHQRKNEIKAISWGSQAHYGDTYNTDFSASITLAHFERVKEYISGVFSKNGFKYSIVDYWTALYKKGSDHPIHNHKLFCVEERNVNYSGILYLSSTGRTHFYSDNVSSWNRAFNINSEFGKIILFPSTTLHSATADPSDERERCIIAFNGVLEPK